MLAKRMVGVIDSNTGGESVYHSGRTLLPYMEQNNLSIIPPYFDPFYKESRRKEQQR